MLGTTHGCDRKAFGWRLELSNSRAVNVVQDAARIQPNDDDHSGRTCPMTPYPCHFRVITGQSETTHSEVRFLRPSILATFREKFHQPFTILENRTIAGSFP